MKKLKTDFYINEKVVYKKGNDKTIFTILDFIFSTKRQKWIVEYSYYNDSIDNGFCNDTLENFEKNFIHFFE